MFIKDFHIAQPGNSGMKSYMRSYVCWPTMKSDIGKSVKSCRECAFATKSPPTKFQPWLKSDIPWIRLYIVFVGPVYGAYYLIAVDSDTKWSEICRCKKPTSTVTIELFHKLLTKYGVPDTMMLYKGTQLTANEFKFFCKIYATEYMTTPLYNPKLNWQAKRFIDIFKRNKEMICSSFDTILEGL